MSTPAVDPGVDEVLGDPAASNWLKSALRESLERDSVNALNDGLALAGTLGQRLRQVFDLRDLD